MHNNFTGVGKFDGVPQDIQQDLSEAARISEHLIGNIRVDMARELEAFLRGPEREQLGRVADHLTKVERRVFKIQAARLDARKIEDVVDNREQRPRRRLDCLEILLLLGGQLRIERQRGHPENRIQRRTNLVAHVGQECALRLGHRRN